jgi:hypothetical protein
MARRHHTRSRRKQPTDPLERLEQLLIDERLHEVLQSLPPPDSWRFQQAPESGSSTIRLFLGYRPKNDGALAQSWACVIADSTELKPPVTFYDQEHDRGRTFPRSASSILRKAEALQPPFCFLQYDPVDKTTGVRDMLCALILYGTLITGADTCALQWDKFEESLCKALRYIVSRDAYHQWQHEQNLTTIRSGGSDQKLTTIRSGGSNQKHTGAVVRPGGGQMTVRPNTSLAKLRDELDEKKLRIIDSLPPIPMTLSPHSLGGNHFPFRMCIGSHSPVKDEIVAIHAYFIHDGTKPVTIRFLSHDDKDKVTAWTVDDLRKATLLDPFKYLNDLQKSSYGTGNGSSARAAKIRSLISYYFLLAENEGLIGNPLVTTGESFVKRLCAAANELQDAHLEGQGRHEEEGGHNEGESADVDVSVPESGSEPTAYTPGPEAALSSRDEDQDEPNKDVQLATQPETMENTAKNDTLQYQDKSPGVEPGQQRCRSSSELPTEVRAASVVRGSVNEENLSPRIAPEAAQPIPTTPINHLDEQDVIGGDRPGTEANDRSPLELFTNEDVQDAPVAILDDKDNLLSSPILPPYCHSMPGTPMPDSEINLESEAALTNSRQANILVAQVMNNRPSTPEASVDRETNDQPIATNSRGSNLYGKVVIDLCSDDEGGKIPLPAFTNVAERTSAARRNTIDLTQISPEPQGTNTVLSKRAFLPDSDDDIIEETDGSGYRQALRGRRR